MSIKRIISLIAALSLIFTICAGYAEEAVPETETEAAVAAPAPAEKESEMTLAASIAIGLGAIEEYDAEKPVTIGEFAKFVDVLTPNGGISQKYFKEAYYQNNIKRVTAVATMCDILGYSIFFSNADISNANASEVGTVASKHDILGGISSDLEGVITMAEAAELLYNTLTAVTLDTTFKADGTVESKISKEIYMEKVLDMYLIDGIVDTTSFSSIKTAKGTEDAYVCINGTRYKAKRGAFEEFIGMSVKALIVKDGGVAAKVLSMFNTSRKMLEVAAKDLIPSDITKHAISYWNENDKKVKVSLSPVVDVLYNYSLFPEYTEDDLKIEQGRLVLIDNNNDSAYDVVKIEDYKSMQVYSVSDTSKIIGNEKGETISIAEMIEYGYPVYERGNIILPHNIPLNSIATVYVNKMGEAVRMYITGDVAAGTINKFEEKNRVTLEGKDYIYAREIKESIEKVPTGSIITVKLNHYGEIAYFEISKEPYLYGYMISFDEGDGITTPRVKMFNQADEIKIYDTKGTIILNGVKMSSNDAFKYDLTSGMWDEAGKISQMVKYKANDKGEITAIYTTTTKDPGDGSRLVKMKDDFLTYYKTPMSFGDDVRLNVYTKVFLIPTDLSFENRFDFGTPEILRNGVDYTVQIYDVDKNYYAGVVVVRIDPYNPSGNSINEIGGDAYIITETGETIVDTGDLSIYCMGRALGSTTNTPVLMRFSKKDISDRGISLTDLKIGDVIQGCLDMDIDEYSDMIVRYKHGVTQPYEDVKQTWASDSTEKLFYSDGNTYAAGVIKEVIKNGIVINHMPTQTPNYENWNRVITTTGVTPVSIVENSKVYWGSVSDLQVGDRVFALYRDGIPMEFVIYR